STATTSATSTGRGSGSPRERSWWLPSPYEGGPWFSPDFPWSSPDCPWSPDWPALSSWSLLLSECAVLDTHLPKALALLWLVPYFSLNAAASLLRSARHSSAALSAATMPRRSRRSTAP